MVWLICFIYFIHLIYMFYGISSPHQEPMYGTRPWCLVQAITRHTCPDPHLGS